ncbi:hypothetical protein KM043_013676 [Ampulex compressa]|nr:hypothetical protein KM043_013676 [Ampulex compressa]
MPRDALALLILYRRGGGRAAPPDSRVSLLDFYNETGGRSAERRRGIPGRPSIFLLYDQRAKINVDLRGFYGRESVDSGPRNRTFPLSPLALRPEVSTDSRLKFPVSGSIERGLKIRGLPATSESAPRTFLSPLDYQRDELTGRLRWLRGGGPLRIEAGEETRRGRQAEFDGHADNLYPAIRPSGDGTTL